MRALVSIQKSTIVRTEIGELTFRVLRPSDVEHLEAMAADLSARSMALRFMAGTPSFPRGMLERLREIDHAGLEAVIACVGTRVVGLAEYVRTSPRSAEFAVLVADRWQHAGIGRQLVLRLADLAKAGGITTFQASVLIENLPARRMVASFWPMVTPISDGECLEYELPLRGAAALVA